MFAMITGNRYNLLISLAAAAFAFGQASNNPLSRIGTPSLESLKYSYDTDISGSNDDCSYTLTVRFTHNEKLPFGNAETCQVDVVAPDGLDYFASRWHYERFDKGTQVATGFDHISIDWNACGHPGFGYQTPHYDFHVYTVSPEFRATEMQCATLHGTPVCKEPSAQTGTGKGYYVFGEVAETRQLDNLPKGYEWEMHGAVEFMGTHGGNPHEDPDHPTLWTEPKLFFTSFNGGICAFEPMFPFTYATGDKSQFYEETVEYEVQTLITLPTYYSVAYDPKSEVTTVVMKGKSTLCNEEFEEFRAMDKDSNPSSAFQSWPYQYVSGLLLVVNAFLFIISVF